MGSITEPESVGMDHRIIKNLFRKSMDKKWDEVVKIYRENPMVHKAKITRSGNTALHKAVFDGEENIVENLVRIIKKDSNEAELQIAVSDDEEDKVEEGVGIIQDSNEADDTPQQRESKKSEAKEVLEIKNERGNTALHLAALIGNVRMCELIARVDRSLVGARNDENETPFFLAALYGHKEAFFCLHNMIYNADKRYDYCRRKDVDTILHCAIDGSHFDLAFQIIFLYEKLVHSINDQGFSPLHRLASNAYAFKSGIHFGICSKIIYYCVFVDELKPLDQRSTLHYQKNRKSPKYRQSTLNHQKNRKHPTNWQTCIDFFRLFQVGFSSLFTTKKEEKNEGNQADAENPRTGLQDTNEAPGHHLYPANYHTCMGIVMFSFKAMLVILGLGYTWIKRIRENKERHVWSVQIMNELLNRTSDYEYENSGTNPGRQPTSTIDGETLALDALIDEEDIGDQKQIPTTQSQSVETNQEDKKKEKNGKDKDIEGQKDKSRNTKGETPILIAAKKGVTEMVEKILKTFPEAIHDTNTDKKNIVLLAVENRQPHVYELLLKSPILEDDTFHKVDINGNNAIHLALKLGHKSWLIPGPALQMHWEIKWLEFVLDSEPLKFFPVHNNGGKNPWDIFAETHKDLLEKGGNWLNDMSQSCSVVAGLLVTVAYATSTTVPGGVKGEQGTPTLEHYTAFGHFAVWSLVAFYSSLSAVVMFLSILTSGYQVKDFRRAVFIKLLLGLTALYISIASTLASFTAGHYFILKDKLKKSAAPVYTRTCLLVTLFAIAQFPIYIKLVWATFKKVPDRSYRSELQYDG